MEDPYLTTSGLTYEKRVIEAYLKLNPIDPQTRKPCKVEELVPNFALKQMLEDRKKGKLKLELL